MRSGDMQRIVERPDSEEAMSISVSRNYMDNSNSQHRGADESIHSQNNNSATEVRQSRTIS